MAYGLKASSCHPLSSNTLDDKHLRGQNWAFSPYVIVYCYLEIKLRYLENLELDSMQLA